MDPQAIRISIDLPDGTAVQVSGGAASATAGGSDLSASSAAIDAGPPAEALLAALGDPETASLTGSAVEVTTDGSSDDAAGAINAGSFPAGLAMEMEAEGPRHPMARLETRMPATPMSPVFSRESRN
jgi:hypothetical protein